MAWPSSGGSAWPSGWGSPCSDPDSTAGAWNGRSTRLLRRSLPPGESLALLYDDWDRNPYPSPFGPFPHDLAVRLYYLDRPACWRQGVEALVGWPPGPEASPFAVVGRERDLPALRRLGRVETLARGPRGRARASCVDDRTFLLFRVHPEAPGRPGEHEGVAGMGGAKISAN